MRTKTKWLSVMLVVALPTSAIGIGLMQSTSDGLAPESMREELVQDIITRWAPEAARQQGPQAKGWGERMAPILRNADMANLERAASAATFEQMGSAMVGRTVSTSLARPGMGAQALAPLGTELVYTAITPCRIVDTRLVGGPLLGGTSRGFEAFTATDFSTQGGDATNCGIPENVAAVTLNLAATNVPRFGNFTIYASDAARPLASSLNYQTGADSSNEVNVKLCRPGCATEFTLFNNNLPNVGVYAVVDVTGYYTEAVAAELDCTVATQQGNLDLLGGLQMRSVACPAGYTATGGGCGGPLGLSVSNSGPTVTNGQPTGWQCDLVGSLLSILSYRVQATCCRTPGR